MVTSTYQGELATQTHARDERGRVVESIRARNRGARVEFLDEFSSTQLSEYLRHLEHAEEPRGSSWVRPTGAPGIVWRESSI
ncbi:MAG: hypothetical protein ACYTF7_04000 [Planctomycetota bacterium]|jgi:hypothetical protein